MSKIFIAIDAGKSGAWGIVDDGGGFVGCGNMPMFEDGTIIARKLWADISHHLGGVGASDVVVGIELVHSMPDDSKSNVATFMYATGIQNAVLQIIGGKPILVSPQKWKKYHGLIGCKKAASTALARDKYGVVVKNNGQAEALLIADFMRCQNGRVF